MDDEQVKPVVAIPLVLFLAIASAILRFANMGSLPLADSEAVQALAANSLLAGVKPEGVTEGLYVSLTGLVYWLFGSSDIIARLVPATAGWAFSLVPLLFRRQLGQLASLMLLGFFAFDPFLITISRSVNGVVLPLFSTSLLVYGLISAKPRFAGFSLALVLLSGHMGWLALAGLALGAVAHGLVKKEPIAPMIFQFGKQHGLDLGLTGLLTIVAISSGLFVQPAMFDVPFNALASVFSRFSLPTGSSLYLPGLGLLFYEAFGLVLGLFGISQLIKKSSDGMWLLIFSFFMFVATFLQSERHILSIAWITPLLLVGASFFVAEFLAPRPLYDRETFGMFLFSIVVLVFMGLNYLSVALVQMDPSATQLRWTVLIGSFTMLAASLVLVTYGWSFSVAWRGLVSALAVFLFAININAAWSASNLRSGNIQGLTDPAPMISTDQVLKAQLEAATTWNFGSDVLKQVSVIGVESPALKWQLRGSSSKYLPAISNPEDLGEIIITKPELVNEELEQAYRGQSFIWSHTVPYDLLTGSEWLKWSVNRTFPVTEQRLILWIKADKFIDRQNNPE